MATRMFLRDTTDNTAGYAATELSTVLPVGTANLAGVAAADLSTTAGAAAASETLNSLAQTTHQDGFYRKFISAPLTGVSSITAQTWTLAAMVIEGNAAANAFIVCSVYVLQSDDTVRGFVYDDDTPLGVEWATTSKGRVVTFTGAAVSGVVSTDRLVLEFWNHSVQGMAAAYANQLRYNGAVVFIDDEVTADPASYLETPQDGLFDSGGTPHTFTQTDLEDLLDSISQVAAYNPAPTDPEGLLDSASQEVAYVRDLTDNLGLVDDATAELTGDVTRTVTDPLGLLDAASPATDSIRDTTDPLGLVDAATIAQGHTRDLTDTLGLVDDGTWLAVGADAVDLVDSVTVAQTHNRDLTDPLGLVDDVTAENLLAASATDPLGLVDAATTAADYLRAADDALGLTDAATPVADQTRTTTDPVGLTDSVTYDLTSGGVAHTATITDSLGLTDQSTFTADYATVIVDPLGVTDTHTRAGDTERGITDLLGLTDLAVTMLTGPGFWSPDSAAYTVNPAAYVPVGPDDTPPAW